LSLPEIGSLVLAVVFGLGGIQQLLGITAMRAMAERLGIDYRLFRFIGCCQLLGALGLVAGVVLQTWMGVAAASGLAVLALLGTGAHFRAKEPLVQYLPALALGTAAVVVAFAL
jgi:hypothetical protein